MRFGLLADDGGDFEDGHQQRDGDGADDQAHEGDHDRLDERGGGTDGILQLFGQEDGDFVADLPDLAGLLAGPHHLDDTGCDQVAVRRGQDRIGELVAVANLRIGMNPQIPKIVVPRFCNSLIFSR